jgi:hypothetical protein
VLKKKIWANFQRIIELFTKTIVKKLLKIWSWDPGSEIRNPGSGKNLFRIPDPGVKKHPIPDPDPQHCLQSALGQDQRINAIARSLVVTTKESENQPVLRIHITWMRI